MGILIGIGDTKPVFPYDYYYGVKINTTVADCALERIGRAELHKSLPIQSRMRRCLLDDTGKVTAYLHPTNSAKTETGATADLTGASGMVMVEIPGHYRKFEFDGTSITALVSEYPLPGFHYVRKMYVSAYEATVDRTTASKPKLASVVNTTTAFRGGGNQSAWDSQSNTMLGKPATGLSLINFRTYARNRGTAGFGGVGWNAYLYEAHLDLLWLYYIEYANLNSQLAFNAQPTSDGYKQGGLGNGVTDLNTTQWSNFSSYYPVIPCGTTNSLGNATGVVAYTMPTDYDSSGVKVYVPSYHGIENPFGHIHKWTDGVNLRVQSDAAGGRSILYRAIDDNPAVFNSSNYNGYEERGDFARTEGFIMSILGGEYGDFLPLTIGGSSTTYFADKFYSGLPTSGEVLRGLLLGGSAFYGARAGLACAFADDVPSITFANYGSRLCFIPNV